MARKSEKAQKESEPLKLFYIFYNKERWDNWITTLAESDFSGDPDSDEMPEGFRVLQNFSLDIILSVLKIIKLQQNGRYSTEDALTKLEGVEEIVYSNPPEGEVVELVRSVQETIQVLFSSCKAYLNGEKAGDIKTLVKEGKKMGDKDPDKLLEIASSIGASVIQGGSCCGKYLKDDMEEPTLFEEWLNTIDSMHEALTSLKNFDEEAGES